MENEKEILLEELETVAETPVSGRKTAAHRRKVRRIKFCGLSFL
jgi:hypothetical protein